MIRISGLQFAYPGSDFRLHVPELAIQTGRKTALIGPSGSGKTTLLNLVAGIGTPAAGRILTNGVEVSSLGEAARRDFRVCNIGLVFQEFELLEHLDVLDNILLPCRITSAVQIGRKLRDRAVELAREVEIEDKLRRYVRKLSQGERQRVALCRALLLEPPLLLCDEPTGNLDPAAREHVLDVLFDYVDHNQTTLLTVTHDHGLLPRFDETVDLSRFHSPGKDGS